MSGHTISDFEGAIDGLNDEIRSALRNIASPAFLLSSEKDERIRAAGEEFLDSVFAMLRARHQLDQLLRRAA